MKRYHVISISALVGLIIGCAVPSLETEAASKAPVATVATTAPVTASQRVITKDVQSHHVVTKKRSTGRTESQPHKHK